MPRLNKGRRYMVATSSFGDIDGLPNVRLVAGGEFRPLHPGEHLTYIDQRPRPDGEPGLIEFFLAEDGFEGYLVPARRDGGAFGPILVPRGPEPAGDRVCETCGRWSKTIARHDGVLFEAVCESANSPLAGTFTTPRRSCDAWVSAEKSPRERNTT